MFSIVVVALLVSCSNETYDSVVPEYQVNYSCNASLVNTYLQQTEQTQLNCPGGYVRVYEKSTLSLSDVIGVGGLLILQNYDGVFYAFDLACPYCYSEGSTAGKVHRIEMKDDGFTAYCPYCLSEYGSVMWGSPAPTSGEANKGNFILRQYQANLLSDGVTVVVHR